MNGLIHISIAKTAFNFPKCDRAYDADFYEKQLTKSYKFMIYKRCLGCKSTMGISSDMTGNVVVWLKKEEKNVIDKLK